MPPEPIGVSGQRIMLIIHSHIENNARLWLWVGAIDNPMLHGLQRVWLVLALTVLVACD